MNILTYLLNRKYPSIYFLIVNFIIFFIAILMRFFEDYFNKTVTGILLVFLECLSFYFLISIFQNLQKQADEDIKRASLYHQKKIQEEHLLAMMQAEEDFDKLSKKFEQIKNSASDSVDPDFQKEMNHLFISYCPNKIVDAILYHKSLIMKKNHINYYVKASVKEQLEIDDFAVLTVLNNMIDNALEAALQSKEKKPYVDICIFTKANYLIIQVENSVRQNFEMTVGKSSKNNPGEHGIGLEIIHQQCKKYHGKFYHEYDAAASCVICTATLRLEER